LALILALQNKGLGGKFFSAGLVETVRSMFGTSRLDRVFRFFRDVAVVLAAI
jgi:hypothetical protein